MSNATRQHHKLRADASLARRNFYHYCHVKAPRFYPAEGRPHLQKLATTLQEFIEEKKHDILIVCMPPRHGKSRTAGNLVEWTLGRYPDKKIMMGTYIDSLSTRFSKNVRNTIQEIKTEQGRLVFSDIFPGVKIRYGDAAMNMWSLEGSDTSYLATTPGGAATGFGADLFIFDDLIKNDQEANNADFLESRWAWFTDTTISRLEEGAQIIVIMTRWATGDIAGRAMEELPELGWRVKTVIEQALQPDGSMLCPEILSRESYDRKVRTMSAEIAAANYQQEPIDLKGRLYSTVKTYDRLPRDKKGELLSDGIHNYTDTADTGSDYLCSINYMVLDKEAYILNVLYTKEPMEITEQAQAKMMYEDCVNLAHIESNAGGRSYARAVGRILKDEYQSNRCVIRPFHQSANKQSRILSNAPWVMEHIYFPQNWRDRWPEFYRDVTQYQKEGKNAHDDAPDALTGIAEKLGGQSLIGFD